MAAKSYSFDASINDAIEEVKANVKKAALVNLQYVAEQALNAARQTKSYKDQTGNLRSSLGYIIAMDGEIKYTSTFEQVKTGGEGTKAGLDYAMQMIGAHKSGIVLLMVAGMEYASFVSAKGYDVLDSAELLAEKLIPQMLSKLKLK